MRGRSAARTCDHSNRRYLPSGSKRALRPWYPRPESWPHASSGPVRGRLPVAGASPAAGLSGEASPGASSCSKSRPRGSIPRLPPSRRGIPERKSGPEWGHLDRDPHPEPYPRLAYRRGIRSARSAVASNPPSRKPLRVDHHHHQHVAGTVLGTVRSRILVLQVEHVPEVFHLIRSDRARPGRVVGAALSRQVGLPRRVLREDALSPSLHCH